MDTNSLFIIWQDKIPTDSAYILRESLNSLREDQLSKFHFISLKDPIIGLVLGIFVGIFGVDRFYKGDIGIGIVKLLVCWLTFGVWWLLDLYLVWQGIKRDNLAKINQVIMYSK